MEGAEGLKRMDSVLPCQVAGVRSKKTGAGERVVTYNVIQ
jgi:hypothetical protein